MIYIVTTLKSAAQTFADRYKFRKTQVGGFVLVSSEKICIIMSDNGTHNTRIATQTLINLYDITDEDIYLYIGSCEDCTASDSFGFHDAVIHSPAIKHFYILEMLPTHETLNQVQGDGLTCMVTKNRHSGLDPESHEPPLSSFWTRSRISQKCCISKINITIRLHISHISKQNVNKLTCLNLD
jgi:hypothetical protein